MTQYRQVMHVESGRVLLPRARWCDSYFSRFRGFTFQRRLGEDEGLVLVEKADHRFNSGITMLFVFFDLGIVWVNNAGEVVDIIVAKPWMVSYLPKAPARYAVELHPHLLSRVEVGDHLRFLEISQ
jgi:uncharacterized membrane protein (UPF0127 family)